MTPSLLCSSLSCDGAFFKECGVSMAPGGAMKCRCWLSVDLMFPWVVKPAALLLLLRSGEAGALRWFQCTLRSSSGVVALPWTKRGLRHVALEMVTIDDPMVNGLLLFLCCNAQLMNLAYHGGAVGLRAFFPKAVEFFGVYEVECAPLQPPTGGPSHDYLLHANPPKRLSETDGVICALAAFTSMVGCPCKSQCDLIRWCAAGCWNSKTFFGIGCLMLLLTRKTILPFSSYTPQTVVRCELSVRLSAGIPVARVGALFGVFGSRCSRCSLTTACESLPRDWRLRKQAHAAGCRFLAPCPCVFVNPPGPLSLLHGVIVPSVCVFGSYAMDQRSGDG